MTETNLATNSVRLFWILIIRICFHRKVSRGEFRTSDFEFKRLSHNWLSHSI
jgi:hypothetical protein